MKKYKFLILIPARKGSKGIVNKNLIKISSLKLIEYTFDIASQFKNIKSFVFTDYEKIKKLAKKYNINSNIIRSSLVSKSTTPMIDTVYEFCKKVSSKNINFDYLILLQPTSVLRSKKDLANAIEIVNKKKYLSLSSISRSLEHPYETLFKLNGNYKLFFKKYNDYTRRQDFDKEGFFINGSIHIIKKSLIFKKKLQDKKKHYYFLLKKIYSLDINDQEDLEIIRKILK